MSSKATIHITFPKAGIENSWVNSFLENFKFSAQKVIGEKFEIRIKNADFDSVSSIKGVSKLDVFLIIMSEKLLETDEYYKELQDLCGVLSLDIHQETGASKIFKILLNSNDSIQQPEGLKQLSGYNFFEYIGRRKAVSILDFEKNNSKTWSRILDVVYDVNDTIKRLSNRDESLNKNFVYLGSCSTDQANYRDDIRRELQHFGFRILPYVDLPSEQASLQDIVNENLSRSKFVIQILGEQYGPLTNEGKNSVFDIENLTIRQFIKNNPDKNQFIWLPAGMKNIESKQELYINRIKRDDSNQQSQIIESTLEEFKNTIAEYLEAGNQYPNEKTDVDLYIISQHNDDISFIDSIKGNLDIEVRKSFEPDKIISYQEHLQLLENTDNILLFYNNADLTWLKSKTGDAVKAMGMGRKAPFKQFVIVSKSKLDIDEISTWLNPVKNILEADTASLKEFFNNIMEFKKQ